MLSLSFILLAYYIVVFFMGPKTLDDSKAEITTYLAISGINILVFFASIALLLPLRRQLGWDLYKIVGADASHISTLLIVNIRNVAHLPAILSSSKGYSGRSSSINAKCCALFSIRLQAVFWFSHFLSYIQCYFMHMEFGDNTFGSLRS